MKILKYIENKDVHRAITKHAAWRSRIRRSVLFCSRKDKQPRAKQPMPLHDTSRASKHKLKYALKTREIIFRQRWEEFEQGGDAMVKTGNEVTNLNETNTDATNTN